MSKITLKLASTTAAAVAAASLSAGAALAQQALLYKNPTCSCCEDYADYLRSNGYDVTVKPSFDLLAISREAGVSDSLMGCHTTIVDGYVVVGHVAVEIVDKLLAERPPIRGVALPGMPMGTPGMGGDSPEPLKVYTVSAGAPEVYGVQ